MKNLILGIVCILFSLAANAEIIYLDNSISEDNQGENIYKSWEGAYGNANPGDSIYVIGSNDKYGSNGNIEIDKPIHIFGPGYFLNKNLETQVDKKLAVFNNILFKEGSDNSSMNGIVVNSRRVELESSLKNITFENCFISAIYVKSFNSILFENFVIRKCYIDGEISNVGSGYSGRFENLIFSNNIVNEYVYFPTGSTGVISNNLFLHNTLSLGISSSFDFFNNIYINSNNDGLVIKPLPDGSVHHNLSITGIFGKDNYNINSSEGSIFVGENNQTTDSKYQLAEQSPAKGKGSGGSDIGPFGGPDPYRLSGLPNLPNIYEIVTGGFVVGDTLPVRVKIKQIKQ